MKYMVIVYIIVLIYVLFIYFSSYVLRMKELEREKRLNKIVAMKQVEVEAWKLSSVVLVMFRYFVLGI